VHDAVEEALDKVPLPVEPAGERKASSNLHRNGKAESRKSENLKAVYEFTA
jgi:hypothetical protein